MLEALGRVFEHTLDRLHGAEGLAGGRKLSRIQRRHFIDSGEVLDGQNWRRGSVELGNLVQDFNGLGLSASADQKLGRLAEGKDKVAQEEDAQSHAAEDDEQVSPAHVAVDGAAGSLAGATSGQVGVAAPLGPCGGAVCNDGCNDDADGLPQ